MHLDYNTVMAVQQMHAEDNCYAQYVDSSLMGSSIGAGFAGLNQSLESGYGQLLSPIASIQQYMTAADDSGLSSPSTIMTASEYDYNITLVDREPTHALAVRSSSISTDLFGRPVFTSFDKGPVTPLTLKTSGFVEPHSLSNTPSDLISPADSMSSDHSVADLTTIPSSGFAAGVDHDLTPQCHDTGSICMGDLQNESGQSPSRPWSKVTLPADVHSFGSTDVPASVAGHVTEDDTDTSDNDECDGRVMHKIKEEDESWEPVVASRRQGRASRRPRRHATKRTSIIPSGEHERVINGRTVTVNIAHDLSDMAVDVNGKMEYGRRGRPGPAKKFCPHVGCGAVFVRPEHLKRHMTCKHATSTVLYTCPIDGCGKIVRSRSDNVVQHVSRHLTKAFKPSSTGNSPVTMAECQACILRNSKTIGEAEKLMRSITVRLRATVKDQLMDVKDDDLVFPHLRSVM